jgi:hypothetical protein
MNKEITKLPYYDTIRDIRNILKKNLPRFPEDLCEESSHLLYRICFKKFKIDEVSGYYTPSKNWHSWNYDPINKVYIDISINHFSKKLPDILIRPKTNYSNILQEDSDVHDEHFKILLTTSFQNRINWLIEKFVKLYPDKREQIIYGS